MTRRSQATRRTARAQRVAADAPASDAEPDAEPIVEAAAETPDSVDTAALWRYELGTTPEPPAGDVNATNASPRGAYDMSR